MTVTDDGRGGAAADLVGGSGLAGLADRVAAVGGALTVDSAPGQGTRVAAELPLTEMVSEPAVSEPAGG